MGLSHSALTATLACSSVNPKLTRPFRIGIVLPKLGRLNLAALQYLILHINVLQNHVGSTSFFQRIRGRVTDETRATRESRLAVLRT